jgi:hypothetical protein
MTTPETDSLGNPKPPFRWSFSQWENYNSCPQRWKFKSIMKLPSSPPGPAAARGLDMHDRAERYIKGEITLAEAVYGDPAMRFGDKKPAVIHQKYIPLLDAYKNHPNGDRGTERKMAFDSEWFLCAPTSRFAACIAVLDAYRYGGERGSEDETNKVLRIGEWKSGSPKDTHADQRKLYAMFGLRAWLAHKVEVTTYYLEDTAPPARLTVEAPAMEKLKMIWQPRIDLMQRDQMCAPRPGVHCNWCDYAKKKGGPCAFGA